METKIVNITDKPNSFTFRWGGTGTDMKIFYNTPEELTKHMENLATQALDLKQKMMEFTERMKQGE